MNHKLLRMIEKAGFEFTPDVMAKLPQFEKLVCLEREACARLLELTDLGQLKDYPEVQIGIANILFTYTKAIRARGQHD